LFHRQRGGGEGIVKSNGGGVERREERGDEGWQWPRDWIDEREEL
jgi:hypothetical protein